MSDSKFCDDHQWWSQNGAACPECKQLEAMELQNVKVPLLEAPAPSHNPSEELWVRFVEAQLRAGTLNEKDHIPYRASGIAELADELVDRFEYRFRN